MELRVLIHAPRGRDASVVHTVLAGQGIESLVCATEQDLLAALDEGAVQRVRPKAMTVAVIVAGLIPIMWSHGTGSEIMQRIAAPMIGGMLTAPLLSMFVIPAAYYLLKRRRAGAA